MAEAPLRAVIRRLSKLVSVRQFGGLSDAALLKRFVVQRDEAAFEVLLWRHGTMVLGVCQRLLHHGHDAEDVFQATFLALAREAASIGRGEALGGWLYKVAFRLALKAKASGARRTKYERRTSAPVAVGPPEELLWRDLRPVLDEEINRLPDKYRQPFVLCYLEGRSNAEAARQLGWPQGTVVTRLGWARERLRQRLSRRGVELTPGFLMVPLPQSIAPAVPAASLVEATLETALLHGTAPAAAVGCARAVALTEGVWNLMSVTKCSTLFGAFLMVGVLATGAGLLAYQTISGKAGPEPAAPVQPQPAQAPAEKAPNREPRQVLAKALEAADAIDDKAARINILVQIALVQDQVGNKTDAVKSLDAALRLVDDVPEFSRGMALHYITTTQVGMHNSKAALKAIDLVKNADQKNHLLFLIAAKQAEIGDVEDALKTAETITDYSKDSALAIVAAAQAKAGDVKAALQTAERLRHQPLSRGSALEEIAVAQAKSGDKPAAASSLQEALKLEVATLAGEDSKNHARARLAILQAQIGDIPGALTSAAGLPVQTDAESADKVHALRGIALEQRKAGDLKGARRTIGSIEDKERQARALIALADSQTEAGEKKAALETLTAALRLADELPNAEQRTACHRDIARAQLKAGDSKPALALIEAHPNDAEHAWLLLDLAEAQAAAGDPKAAVASWKRAWKAALAMKEEENQPCVQTLAPRTALLQGHLLRRIVLGLMRAGEEREAAALAAQDQAPLLRALTLLGVAEGLSARKDRPKEAKP
jgi:RNA polymerase sigma factor (sigma-70 family)